MKQKILLGLILLLALFLRTYQLDAHPPGFYSDEASWAYNAYSIFQTARDEYGRFLPWTFEAFGDFKLPVTVYSITASFWVFGVSDWSARLPTAIYGVLSVLAVYFLVKELISKNNQGKIINHQRPFTINYSLLTINLPLLAALLLSITPAHIFLSRGIWDIQPALFFTILGTTFFLKAIRNIKQKLLTINSSLLPIFANFLLSSISFVLSMYSYNSARVITPLLILILAIGFCRHIFKLFTIRYSLLNFSAVLIPLLTDLLLLSPQLLSLTDPAVTQRATYVSIFNRGDVEAKIYGATSTDGSEHPLLLIRLLHNKPVFYASEILQRYLQHFELNYLFLTGDTFEIFKVEAVGVLPLLALPFLIIGLVGLLSQRPPGWWLIIGWLLLAPIPSALTVFTPSVSRSHSAIVPLVILVAFGLLVTYQYLLDRIQSGQLKSPALTPLTIKTLFFSSAALSVWYWHHQYFILTPVKVDRKWGAGWETVVNQITAAQSQNQQIFVSNTQGPSYIWLAWYQRLDPQTVWQTRVTDFTPDSNGLNNTSRLNSIIFTKSISAECALYTHSAPTTCIGFPGEIGPTATKISSPSGQVLFEVLVK